MSMNINASGVIINTTQVVPNYDEWNLYKLVQLRLQLEVLMHFLFLLQAQF